MLRINNKEKQRILEIHRNNSMKPWLSITILNEQSSVYTSINSEQEGDNFRDWALLNYSDISKAYGLVGSSHPDSKFYHSNSMNSVWNYYDSQKKQSLGDLYLKSRNSSTQQVKNYDWQFQNVNIDPESFYEKRSSTYVNPSNLLPSLSPPPSYPDPFKDQPVMTARYGKTPGVKEYSPEEFKQYMKNQEKWDNIMKKHPLHSISTPKWEEMSSEQKHWFLMCASIGTAFIPYIGLFISAGIDMYDASLYLEEQRNKEASVSAFFAVLSLIPYANKIKIIGNFGDDILISLSKKLGVTGTKNLTKSELELMKHTAQMMKTPEGAKYFNEGLVQWGAKKVVESAEDFNKFKNITNGIAIGAGLTYGIAGAPMNPIYKYIFGPSAYELFKSKGYDDEKIKILEKSFMAESPSDFELMRQAILDENATLVGGWDVNRPVPLKYQTERYKSKIKDIVNSLESIAARTPDKDARHFGSFGRILSIGEYNYKFIDNKYYKRKLYEGQDFNEVIDKDEINEIHQLFTDQNLIKHPYGYVYVNYD